MTRIADKLTALAEEHGRDWMRRRSGIECVPFARYLSGRNRPALDTIVRIARAVGVDPMWLADDNFDLPPVQLSSAFLVDDDDTLNEVDRARLALHRAVDLLPASALVNVLEYVRDQSRQQATDGEGSESGHALRLGSSSSSEVFASHSVGAPNVSPDVWQRAGVKSSPARAFGACDGPAPLRTDDSFSVVERSDSTDGEAPAVESSRGSRVGWIEGDVRSNAASSLVLYPEALS